MDSPRLVYRPAPDATPEGEVRALAEAYSLILKCHAKKKGGVSGTAPNDGKGIDKHVPARTSIPDE